MRLKSCFFWAGLFFFFLKNFALGVEPFPGLNQTTLLEKLSHSIQAGRSVNQAFGEIADFVFQEAPLGKKVCLNQDQECYEVAGIHVNMDYSVNGVGEAPLIRNAGAENLPVYQAITFRWDHQGIKNGQEFQMIFEFYITIDFKESQPELIFEAEKTVLEPGEKVNLKAKLNCGEALLKQQKITFSWQGPGEIKPAIGSTGGSGVAEVVFQAREVGKTVMTATYGELKKSLEIETKKAEWQGTINYSFQAGFPGSESLPVFSLKIEVHASQANLFLVPADPEEMARVLKFSGPGSASYSYKKHETIHDDYEFTESGAGGSTCQLFLSYSRGQAQGHGAIGFKGVKIKSSWVYEDFVREVTNNGSSEFEKFEFFVVEDIDPDPNVFRGQKNFTGPYSMWGEAEGRQTVRIDFDFRKKPPR